jgi:hypothetical protein
VIGRHNQSKKETDKPHAGIILGVAQACRPSRVMRSATLSVAMQ